MKKLVLIGTSLLFMLGMLLLDTTGTLSNPNGAPASNTGSPGDLSQTCARSGCHAGTASDRDGMISTDIPASGYVAGQTYTITVSITQSGISKWGFQLSPQTNAGSLVGTLTLSDNTRTRFVGSGNKYVTHTTAGNSGASGTSSWNMSWTAPAAGTGDVTFYAAVMAANGNGNTSGDLVFKDNLTISEDPTSALNKVEYVYTPFAFPNPIEGNEITLNVPSKVNVFQLFDLNGRLWLEIPNSSKATSYVLDITKVPVGVYLLKMKSDTTEYMQRIIRR
jgi:hypothetical protein